MDLRRQTGNRNRSGPTRATAQSHGTRTLSFARQRPIQLPHFISPPRQQPAGGCVVLLEPPATNSWFGRLARDCERSQRCLRTNESLPFQRNAQPDKANSGRTAARTNGNAPATGNQPTAVPPSPARQQRPTTSRQRPASCASRGLATHRQWLGKRRGMARCTQPPRGDPCASVPLRSDHFARETRTRDASALDGQASAHPSRGHRFRADRQCPDSVRNLAGGPRETPAAIAFPWELEPARFVTFRRWFPRNTNHSRFGRPLCLNFSPPRPGIASPVTKRVTPLANTKGVKRRQPNAVFSVPQTSMNQTSIRRHILP
ncbi:hypothetical protein RISK_001383 [Rhodopirellula islandica]|uniref:Uncharacterized protein n=1 Tax=Rhodopirellula islandica TaxID=595434 RepID=A0A0J1BJM0_RHOIS|nr:hypothetical protein RISK_001383 [Rhodopirellula islandica]